MQQFLYGGLLIAVAALCGWWTKTDLQRGETRMDLWMRPRREDAPALFWMAVVGQGVVAAFFLIAGLALIFWGFYRLA